MLGWQDVLPLEALWGGIVTAGLGLIAALFYAYRHFRKPSRAEALVRVDQSLPGRPVATLSDKQAIGSRDPASIAVWQAHRRRMEARLAAAQPVEPHLQIADRDPFGLRYLALLFFVMALLFGSFLRVGTVGTTVTGTGGTAIAAGPVWEGWIEPPAYTGKPALYLNDIPQGVLRAPAGSTVTLRLYGEVGALTVAETVSGRTDDLGAASDLEQSFPIAQSGGLRIDGPNGAAWEVTAIPDNIPEVDMAGPIEADAMGEFTQPFSAYDDYGIEAGRIIITRATDAIDRRHGLATDPDPAAPLVLDLPLPFTGDRADFDEFIVENLSQHPFANMPVVMQLEVTDAAGQIGLSQAEAITLPGRRFFQPVARAVIEQRRDLLWSSDNARRVSQILRAISHRPEDLFTSETTYLRMRAIIRRIESVATYGLSNSVKAELSQALWDLAVQLEDGRLADARERLARAQQRLSEAMRNGASDAEIEELMQELREATDDYMRLLAEEAEPSDGGERGEGQELSMSELDAMMDRIEELMREGRMAEAQELMEQLNQLMENMRMAQSEGGEGQGGSGQQAMDDLSETLRDQEQLSDDSFQELQDQTNQGQQSSRGQEGQQSGAGGNRKDRQGEGQGVGDEDQLGMQDDGGSGGEGGGNTLAERQGNLRDELERQRGSLSDLSGEAGETARQALERAQRAMEGAEGALRDGDLPEAIDQQAEALDALRNGLQQLNRALAENDDVQRGQGSQQGQARSRSTSRDPLGREAGNMGQLGSDDGMLADEQVRRRAEELLDEIRRRSSERERPELERDYLRRLLDQF